MFVDVGLDPSISITSHVSGCEEGPLVLRQLRLCVKGQSTFTQNVGGPVFDRGGQGLNR